MKYRGKSYHAWLLASAAATAVMWAGSAAAEDAQFNIAPQPLASALNEFSLQSKQSVLFTTDLAAAKSSQGVSGQVEVADALSSLLAGTGLTWKRNGNTFLITSASDPQSGSAAGDGADAGTVAALIVTAQKKEENIQDVPIAISAFTEKSLQEQKIEGGFDLLKAIPNVTFSKNNFTSFNFSIRGIGTKAVSATTDPGVAVSFNNIALIQNRLFEQEYFDVERVEVLRGPQGTLYGRNATAGVINVISAKPNLTEFSGWVKGEVGNYHAKRVSAMVNVPLIEDKLGVRIAGALTDRAGYDYNSVTKHAINGRDLWSGRITVAFNPTESIRTNLIWERFNEDDDRSRTGKQLCHRDPGLQMLGSTPVVPAGVTDPISIQYNSLIRPAMFSQGCKPGSLYDPNAFGTPNGLALPFVFAMLSLGGPCSATCGGFAGLGVDDNGVEQTLLQMKDPYGGMMQSPDLRVIASFKDPKYRARADVLELNFQVDLTRNLTLSSQTAYDKDTVYSFQDYNRFNTVPAFQDPANLWSGGSWLWDPVTGETTFHPGAPGYYHDMAPGGFFCDPQLGCSNTLAGFDISRAKSEQFTQEIRLQSAFDGPVNFSLGANYTHFRAMVDYYVFNNLITAVALTWPFNGGPSNPGPDIAVCSGGVFGWSSTPLPIDDPNGGCPYIDPNPIESINGNGHNYFRSKNPYKLSSGAVFGELYWDATDRLKVTAGLRYTDDRKTFIPVPSQVLLAKSLWAGGAVNLGYPELPPIKQQWGEWTGRVGVDWKPSVSFTDQTMLYAFYSHGYKGGGANPPTLGFATLAQTRAIIDTVPVEARGILDYLYDNGYFPALRLTGQEYEPTFRPEFVNALEFGAKNTLFGGGLLLNGDVFFYDYKDYQVSQIRDRTAVNENFDARTWGAELETVFSPSRNLHVNANLGYLDTAIGHGMRSIDIMDRTAGNSAFVLVKPWMALPSNCVIPVGVAASWASANPQFLFGYWDMCGGLGGGPFVSHPIDPNPAFGGGTQPYDYHNYPELNGGSGIAKDLSGKELPNAPHWTMNLGAQYSVNFLDDAWRATVRADAYWQSQSWARVYNDNPYDKLHGWYNVNLSMWFERPEDDLKIEIYAKNVLDKSPITDAFLNSDDSALTTNVFTLDPRLIGLSIKKGF